jgi:hypothetical protein
MTSDGIPPVSYHKKESHIRKKRFEAKDRLLAANPQRRQTKNLLATGGGQQHLLQSKLVTVIHATIHESLKNCTPNPENQIPHHHGCLLIIMSAQPDLRDDCQTRL